MNKVIYIMGVSGCGKSTIGKALSDLWDVPFYDGDDFHPEANIQKMSDEQPLNDDDRAPWLKAINQFAQKELTSTSCIMACSALKQSYRDLLSDEIADQTIYVHLDGTFEQIQTRMMARNHFMPASLLRSQFDTLEPPNNAIVEDISRSIDDITTSIDRKINNR